MQNELRPPHEVIIEHLQRCSCAINIADGALENGGGYDNEKFIPTDLIFEGRIAEIGKLTGLLDVLKEMKLSADQLREVIEALKLLTSDHLEVGDTIRKLEERRGVAA